MEHPRQSVPNRQVIPTVIKNDRWHEFLFGAPPPPGSIGQPGARYQPPKSLE